MPEDIETWRPGQEDLIEKLLNQRVRCSANCAPTGFGKTDVYMYVARYLKRRTCIVTMSKALQDQVVSRYEQFGAVDVRGRSNYQCDMKPGYTCEDGYAVGCPYRNSATCSSRLQELRAAVAPIVVTNYDKWCAAKCATEGFENFDHVVFDEGHNLPMALAKQMQVVITPHEINDVLHIDFPPIQFQETIDGWATWARDAKNVALELRSITLEKIKATTTPKAAWLRLTAHLTNLITRLTTVSCANSKNWVVEEMNNGFQFDAIHPGKYVESSMLFRVPSFSLLSATLRPKTLYMGGISRVLSEFTEYDSSFDRDLSPVYWVRTARVDHRNPYSITKVWNRFEQFASRRRDRNGIVHTVSYERQRDILAYTNHADRMYFADQGDSSYRALDNFRNADRGSILVGPQFGTGYDFPDKECEWQFIAKIPFIDGRSKIVKARTQLDKEYGLYLAYQSLVQMVGRGTRRPTDRCETIIPDDNCEWFIPKYAHLAPKSFYGDKWNNIEGFYKPSDYLPEPPPRLE